MGLLGSGFGTYAGTVDAAAGRYGVPSSILASVIQQESSFNPNVRVGAAGDTGIAQFIPSTARALGIDPTDPNQSIFGAAELLNQNYSRTGTWSGALSMYNSGSATGAPGYASQVLNRAGQISKAAGGGALSGAVSTLTSKATSLLKGAGDVAFDAAKDIPFIGGALGGIGGALGFGSDSCGIICQIQNWLGTTKFFNRVGLVIVGFILLFAAFYLLGRQTPEFKAAARAFA